MRRKRKIGLSLSSAVKIVYYYDKLLLPEEFGL